MKYVVLCITSIKGCMGLDDVLSANMTDIAEIQILLTLKMLNQTSLPFLNV